MKDNTPITPENVLASVKEMFAESRAEFDKAMAESRADWERRMKESGDRFDREMEKSRAEWEHRMKKLDEHMGGMANSQGMFAEEYFFNSFENGQQNFFGEKFDEIIKHAKGWKNGFKDEYDILMLNGHAIGIVEVKFKAVKDYIPKVIKKAHTFRGNFPEYQNHKIYLALAAMTFDAGLEQECIKEGIAVVKQVGDTVTIYDEHIKAF